jgi:hypothetical protein
LKPRQRDLSRDVRHLLVEKVFGAPGRLKPIESVGMFADVLETHNGPDLCLLADEGQHQFTDASTVLMNDGRVRVATGERKHVRGDTNP